MSDHDQPRAEAAAAAKYVQEAIFNLNRALVQASAAGLTAKLSEERSKTFGGRPIVELGHVNTILRAARLQILVELQEPEAARS